MSGGGQRWLFVMPKAGSGEGDKTKCEIISLLHPKTGVVLRARSFSPPLTTQCTPPLRVRAGKPTRYMHQGADILEIQMATPVNQPSSWLVDQRVSQGTLMPPASLLVRRLDD